MPACHWDTGPLSPGPSLGWGGYCPKTPRCLKHKAAEHQGLGDMAQAGGAPILGQGAAGGCAESLAVMQLLASPGRAPSVAPGSLQPQGPGARIQSRSPHSQKRPDLPVVAEGATLLVSSLPSRSVLGTE